MANALKFTIEADGRQAARELTNVQRLAAQFSRGIRGSFQAQQATGARGSFSTLVNPKQSPDTMWDYGDWWKKALTEKDIEEASRRIRAGALRRQRAEERAEEARLGGVESASRSNRAAALRRQRAEERAAEARTGSVEAASRSNRAAALRRQRAEERAEEARTGSVEAASRSNRAAALRRQRAEERANREAERAAATPMGQFKAFTSSAIARFTGGLALGYGAKRLVEFSNQMDRSFTAMRTTLTAAAGSAEKGAEDFAYLRQEADRVGFSLLGVGGSFSRFSLAAQQAGLGRKETRDIFSAVTGAGAVMGMDSNRQSEALLALEQMLSKTTVSMQELRLQLGNAMPAAVNTFAKALGMSTKELFAQVEAGNVLSKDALPKFAEQLRKTFPLSADSNRSAREAARAETAKAEAAANFGEAIRPFSIAWNTGVAAFSKMLGSPIQNAGQILAGQDTYTIGKQQSDLRAKEAELERRQKEKFDARNQGRDTTPAELKEREAAAKFEKEMREEEEKQRIAGMTQEERRADLQNKIRRKQDIIDSAEYEGTSPEEVRGMSMDVLKMKGELSDLDRDKSKDKSNFKLNLTDQQTHGAFSAFGNVALLDVSKGQLQTQKQMLTAIQALAGKSKGGGVYGRRN